MIAPPYQGMIDYNVAPGQFQQPAAPGFHNPVLHQNAGNFNAANIPPFNFNNPIAPHQNVVPAIQYNNPVNYPQQAVQGHQNVAHSNEQQSTIPEDIGNISLDELDEFTSGMNWGESVSVNPITDAIANDSTFNHVRYLIYEKQIN